MKEKIFYNEAVKKAVIKYEKENIKRVVLKLNKKTDQDIIDHLKKIDGVNGYLKQLIRKDI